MTTYRTWQAALEDCNVVDDWLRERESWPEWSWAHLTDRMVDEEIALPFRVIYGVLVERSGLPMPSRAVLHYLARRCGGPAGSPRRCWPPLDVIADRVGASRRTVQRAIETAEAAGWVKVVRHKRAPSDYVLDVPALDRCRCLDCRDPDAANVRDDEHDTTREGVRESPQGVRESPLTGQSDTSRVSESHTHLVHALGSSLDSDHQRRPSDDGTTVVESKTGPDPGPDLTTYLDHGALIASQVQAGDMDRRKAAELLEAIPKGELRDAVTEGFRAFTGAAA